MSVKRINKQSKKKCMELILSLTVELFLFSLVLYFTDAFKEKRKKIKHMSTKLFNWSVFQSTSSLLQTDILQRSQEIKLPSLAFNVTAIV